MLLTVLQLFVLRLCHKIVSTLSPQVEFPQFCPMSWAKAEIYVLMLALGLIDGRYLAKIQSTIVHTRGFRVFTTSSSAQRTCCG